MRVSNYQAAEQQLIQQTLASHLETSSALVSYSPDCIYDNTRLCFYNASSYGFPDMNYQAILKNASIVVGGVQNLQPCPLHLMMPFMDNTALYTGYSGQLLSQIKYCYLHNYTYDMLDYTYKIV